jgi:glycosyltransferase involved in cell wall biosynthesis
MRIAVIINMITPYQRPVFERLAERDDCELLVIYETERESNRRWREDQPLRYAHVILDSWSLNLARFAIGSGVKLSSDIYVHVPKRPLSPLIRFVPNVVVAAGGGMWASPTNLAALAGRRRHGWAFVPRWESFARRRPTLPRRVAEPWVRRFMRSGDAWIAIGSRSHRDLVHLGADERRIFVSPLVAEPAGPSGPGGAEGRTRFLFVGQLIERKGVDVLLDAFAQVERGELAIAGEGPLAERVKAASATDGRIEMLGHLDRAKLQDAYAGADVLVLPSLYDVWGLVVNEALARGLLIITTDQVGAADDLVEHGVNGVIVPAGSVSALADAMRVVGEWSPERRAAAQALTSERLTRTTAENSAQSILEACRCAVDHRSRA